MEDITKGCIVKFHTPLPEENPDQLYTCLFVYPAWEQVFKDGTKQIFAAKADIRPLNPKYTFAGINSVYLADLMIADEKIQAPATS